MLETHKMLGWTFKIWKKIFFFPYVSGKYQRKPEKKMPVFVNQ